MTEVTLAGITLPNVRWDVQGNAARLERLAREAAARGADLIVAPEACLDGYCLADLHGSTPTQEQLDRYRSVAQVWPDAPVLRRLADVAAELGDPGVKAQPRRTPYNTAHRALRARPVSQDAHRLGVDAHTPGDSLPVSCPLSVYGISSASRVPRSACASPPGCQLLIVPPTVATAASTTR